MQQSLHQLLGLASITFLMSGAGGAPIHTSKPSKRDVPLDIATVLETPLAATLYDPSASWKAPLVPAGKFNPMPLITKVPLPPAASSSDSGSTSAKTTSTSNGTATPPSSVNLTKALSDTMQVDQDMIKGLTDSLSLAEDSLNSTTLALPLPTINGTKLDTSVVKANTTATQKRALLDRRSMKREWTGVLKRRSTPAVDDLKDIWCPSDHRETLVPVTFTELFEMKIGKSMLQPSFNATAPPPASGNPSSGAKNVTSTPPFAAFQTPQCVDKLMSTVIVVPVSELQMSAIENGALVMKSTEQRGVVTLMTSAEMELDDMTGQSSVPAIAGDAYDEQDADGPTFVVVPVPANATSTVNTKLPVSNTISGPGLDSSNANQTTKPSVNATAPTAPAKSNTTAPASTPAQADPPLTILGPASLKRRSRGMPTIVEQGDLVKRADEFQRLQRRVKPSNASNTEIIGNGEGKRKYGHAIHFNAAPDAFSVPTSAALFVVGSLFASLYL